MDHSAVNYRRYLDGDDTGLVEIIKEHKDGLTLYLNSYVRNIFIAEELMEETFFKLVTKRPRFSGKSSFKTWLFAIARNMAVDHLRRNSHLADTPLEDLDNYLAEETDVENEYLKKEQKIILHNAMKKLKSEYFQILYLIYFEDFTNSDAGIIMKKNKRQIENLVYRAKQALKSELEKENFVYEEL